VESLADLVVRAQKGDVAAFGSVVRATQLMAFAVVLPNRTVKIAPTEYPMCRQAWELAVEDDGQWVEVLAWGVFTDKIVHHVGGDPRKHVAVGVGAGSSASRCCVTTSTTLERSKQPRSHRAHE